MMRTRTIATGAGITGSADCPPAFRRSSSLGPLGLWCFFSWILQAALAVKRLAPCASLPLIVPAPADPAPCPVFAALSYL